jgi:hypothetical protein
MPTVRTDIDHYLRSHVAHERSSQAIFEHPTARDISHDRPTSKSSRTLPLLPEAPGNLVVEHRPVMREHDWECDLM